MNHLPAILLDEVGIWPHFSHQLRISDSKSIQALNISRLIKNNKIILTVKEKAQKEVLSINDIGQYGIAGEIKSVAGPIDGEVLVTIESGNIVKLIGFDVDSEYWSADFMASDCWKVDEPFDYTKIVELASEYFKLKPTLGDGNALIALIDRPVTLISTIANILNPSNPFRRHLYNLLSFPYLKDIASSLSDELETQIKTLRYVAYTKTEEFKQAEKEEELETEYFLGQMDTSIGELLKQKSIRLGCYESDGKIGYSEKPYEVGKTVFEVSPCGLIVGDPDDWNDLKQLLEIDVVPGKYRTLDFIIQHYKRSKVGSQDTQPEAFIRAGIEDYVTLWVLASEIENFWEVVAGLEYWDAVGTEGATYFIARSEMQALPLQDSDLTAWYDAEDTHFLRDFGSLVKTNSDGNAPVYVYSKPGRDKPCAIGIRYSP